jgi:hypothetical protein
MSTLERSAAGETHRPTPSAPLFPLLPVAQAMCWEAVLLRVEELSARVAAARAVLASSAAPASAPLTWHSGRGGEPPPAASAPASPLPLHLLFKPVGAASGEHPMLPPPPLPSVASAPPLPASLAAEPSTVRADAAFQSALVRARPATASLL